MVKVTSVPTNGYIASIDNGKELPPIRPSRRGTRRPRLLRPPWEHGLNENTNGLIRQYLPKDTDFWTLTLEKVCSIMDPLNNRPRKCLGFKTPNQLSSGINPPVCTYELNPRLEPIYNYNPRSMS
jgi:IS30 family transposase